MELRAELARHTANIAPTAPHPTSKVSFFIYGNWIFDAFYTYIQCGEIRRLQLYSGIQTEKVSATSCKAGGPKVEFSIWTRIRWSVLVLIVSSRTAHNTRLYDEFASKSNDADFMWAGQELEGGWRPLEGALRFALKGVEKCLKALAICIISTNWTQKLYGQLSGTVLISSILYPLRNGNIFIYFTILINIEPKRIKHRFNVVSDCTFMNCNFIWTYNCAELSSGVM